MLIPVFLVLSSVPGTGQERSDALRIDMSQWFRRDWDECEAATRFGYANGVARIVSERSAALFWQIPTVEDGPMALSPEAYPWLGECKRPPMGFNREIKERGVDDLMDVAVYRYVTWRWKVEESTIEVHRLGKDGKLATKYDDFPAKIGISILKKGSDIPREVAYVWSKTLPDGMMFKRTTTIIPMIWTLKWRRFVAESGTETIGRWVSETRDLYADFQKGYPGEVPGKILRVYLMTDSDNTQSRTSASYAAIVFHKRKPGSR